MSAPWRFSGILLEKLRERLPVCRFTAHSVETEELLGANEAQPDAFVDDVDLSEDADLLGENGEPRWNRTINPQIKSRSKRAK
jgi:hypothetical protein